MHESSNVPRAWLAVRDHGTGLMHRRLRRDHEISACSISNLYKRHASLIVSIFLCSASRSRLAAFTVDNSVNYLSSPPIQNCSTGRLSGMTLFRSHSIHFFSAPREPARQLLRLVSAATTCMSRIDRPSHSYQRAFRGLCLLLSSGLPRKNPVLGQGLGE